MAKKKPTPKRKPKPDWRTLPRKPVTRGQRITIRLTEIEADLLAMAAAARSQSVSEFARAAVNHLAAIAAPTGIIPPRKK